MLEKLDYKTKILRPIFASSLLLVIAIGALFFCITQIVVINKSLDDIEDARYLTVKLQSKILNAEAGQRGYLLTNNIQFANDFEAARNELRIILSKLLSNASMQRAVLFKLNFVKSALEKQLYSLDQAMQVQMISGAYAPHLNSAKMGLGASDVLMSNVQEVLDMLDQEKEHVHAKIKKILQYVIVVTISFSIILIVIMLNGYRRTVDLFEIATKSQSQAEIMTHDAFHDVLTDLANRRYFETYYKNILAMAARDQKDVAIMCLDLDGFKAINDRWGHEAGDIALKEVARRLSTKIRSTDFFARMGGDEFALIVQQHTDPYSLEIFASRLIGCLDKAIDIVDEGAKLGVSIGVSIFPKHAKEATVLLQMADDAMYQAKKSGKNKVVFAS